MVSIAIRAHIQPSFKPADNPRLALKHGDYSFAIAYSKFEREKYAPGLLTLPSSRND
jgi:hypothetical protein